MSTSRNLDTPSMPASRAPRTARRADGYALVALLALMTILILATMAAAPSLRQQSQRELEQEAIVRGEEVAEAIRFYINCTGNLPTSMKELLEGAPCGRVEKVQVLRAYAARDPLSSTGEWRLIRPTDQALRDFAIAVALYNDNQLPKTNDPKLAKQPMVQGIINMPLTGIVNTKTKEDEESSRDDEEESSTTSTGPFIGVASRSQRDSVITYYAIEQQNKWVFTPLFR